MKEMSCPVCLKPSNILISFQRGHACRGTNLLNFMNSLCFRYWTTVLGQFSQSSWAEVKPLPKLQISKRSTKQASAKTKRCYATVESSLRRNYMQVYYRLSTTQHHVQTVLQNLGIWSCGCWRGLYKWVPTISKAIGDPLWGAIPGCWRWTASEPWAVPEGTNERGVQRAYTVLLFFLSPFFMPRN